MREEKKEEGEEECLFSALAGAIRDGTEKRFFFSFACREDRKRCVFFETKAASPVNDDVVAARGNGEDKCQWWVGSTAEDAMV